MSQFLAITQEVIEIIPQFVIQFQNLWRQLTRSPTSEELTKTFLTAQTGTFLTKTFLNDNRGGRDDTNQGRCYDNRGSTNNRGSQSESPPEADPIWQALANCPITLTMSKLLNLVPHFRQAMET